MIDFRRLTYTYPAEPQPALVDVTLHIDEGEFVLVTGASGAGKSTLLRCLNGLVPHFTGGTLSGRVTVAGHDPVAEGPQVLSRLVGFVFQHPEAQFVVDRVEDEVAFALENQAVPVRQMRERVRRALEVLDLLLLRDRTLETLSGGEKQRVAIATALALEPRILVLDEPTSQLDPQSAAELLDALVRLNRELGLTIVLAEHRLERVLPYVDRLIYLSGRGEEFVSGPPRRALREVDLTPPLVTLGKALDWDPLPLSVEEARSRISAPKTPSADSVSDGRGRPCSAPRLVVQDLCFAYDDGEVLSGVDLEVASGELMVLMGPNGSGKTTLLKSIVGLLEPQGQITLDGESLVGRRTADICRDVGYLPQEPDALLFADTVDQELEVTLRNHGLLEDPPLDPTQLLRRLDLEETATSYPRDLSVGQRQRVALGAVTVTRPQLLLLDEPTRGMDYHAKRELVRLLEGWQDQGAAVLLVTHDVEFAAQAADRVAVLNGGRIVADGAPTDIFSRSLLFAPQMARLFPGTGWLTVEDAVDGLL